MKLLSRLFTLDSNVLERRLINSLFAAVKSVTDGSPLCLTVMGRQIGTRGVVKEKHSIKRIDRLLGNPRFHKANLSYYQRIAQLFANNKSPLIHVDWSTIYNYDFVLLRASISFQGRAITLCESVYSGEKHNNHKVHQKFLLKLKQILPPGVKPIICTDAGFKVPWFKEIECLGWYWLARTRGTVKCQFANANQWQYVSNVHQQATGKAKELPPCLLSKAQQHLCRGVLYRAPSLPLKKAKKRIHTRDANNLRHIKSAKEPWFLVSNLPAELYKPQHLVNFYKRRMAIEESFRDSKNEYYGLGLSRSRSRSIERLESILLIAMLAQLYLYCLGKASETLGHHRDFQANTIKHRRVLSFGYLGQRVLMHPSRYKVSIK